MKKTPIYDAHINDDAKMVEFAGWTMPIQYEGLKQEHLHTRSQIGIFDVSHMGEIWVTGDKSLETLQWLTTNDVAKLESGQAQYSLFPNGEGGVVDDLIIYCIKPGHEYLLCVNAANTEKDFQFLKDNNRGADIVNRSEEWGQIAIQGPKAMELLKTVVGEEIANLKSFHFMPWQFGGKTCYVARTGYTGEDGAEIFVPAHEAYDLWLTFQQSPLVKPIGLGARDTLRMEMKYPLYGQEITDTTNPYEAGLGWVVKPKAKDFLGKKAMLDYKERGIKQKLVGLEMVGRGIARQGYKVFSFDKEEVGEVTSGTQSPTLNKAIAIAYVPISAAEPGTKLNVEIRGKMVEAQVVPTPFVKPGGN